MMSLDEAIFHAEEVATEQELLMGRYDAASGYARSGNESIRTESAKECEKCAGEHRQLAAWLRELQERRKQPEIIRCKDCAYYDWDCVDAPYGMTKMICWCDLHYDAGNENLVVNPDDYCKWAKRRSDEAKRSN